MANWQTVRAVSGDPNASARADFDQVVYWSAELVDPDAETYRVTGYYSGGLNFWLAGFEGTLAQAQAEIDTLTGAA